MWCRTRTLRFGVRIHVSFRCATGCEGGAHRFLAKRGFHSMPSAMRAFSIPKNSLLFRLCTSPFSKTSRHADDLRVQLLGGADNQLTDPVVRGASWLARICDSTFRLATMLGVLLRLRQSSRASPISRSSGPRRRPANAARLCVADMYRVNPARMQTFVNVWTKANIRVLVMGCLHA